MLEQGETRGKLISVETKLCVFCFLQTKTEVALGRKQKALLHLGCAQVHLAI